MCTCALSSVLALGKRLNKQAVIVVMVVIFCPTNGTQEEDYIQANLEQGEEAGEREGEKLGSKKWRDKETGERS